MTGSLAPARARVALPGRGLCSASLRVGQERGILGAMRTGLRIVGTLGGVGSGKSTAARLLAEQAGGTVVDADRLVGDLFQDSQVLTELEQAVGALLRSENGSLDRAKLAQRIFADADARQRAEAVLHPRVRFGMWTALEAWERERPGGLAVLDVPLLLEHGLSAVCDFLVFVEVPEDLRASRAMSRHGWSREEWASREAAQAPVAAKRAQADAILVNDAGLERLREQCAALAVRLQDLPARALRLRWPSPGEAPRPLSRPAPPPPGQR